MKNSTKDISKIKGLNLINYIAENYPNQIKLCLIEIMTPICDFLYNPKKNISNFCI